VGATRQRDTIWNRGRPMEIYTAGFAEWTAEQFFGVLSENSITRLIDVRLKPSSQLAGFAKQRDLGYFLRSLCNADYVHELMLAPSSEILEAYRKKKITWSEYEAEYLALLRVRKVESVLEPDLFSGLPVLLCSEHRPENCHRRLAVEYLQKEWGTFTDIVHLA
jgi:uncharacterized protein (DUF488 family)